MAEYPEHGEPLTEGEVDDDPARQFSHWFERAAPTTRLPEAVALATTTAEGDPAVRMVLLKSWDADGFVFFTNYESDKARQLAEHPSAALVVYWDQLGRQVRIDGPVRRVGAARSRTRTSPPAPGGTRSAPTPRTRAGR